MNKYIINKLLPIVCFLCFPTLMWGQETLKIASYNIWDGFENDSLRRTNFVTWARCEKPDILVLNELVGFKANNLAALASDCGYTYHAIQKEDGYPVGVLSATPIEVISKRTTGFWHGMIHVRTANIDVVATHLSPFDWKFRLKEARHIVHYIDSLQLKDYLVAGDLNAISPLDADEIGTHNTWIENTKRGDAKRPDYNNLKDGRFDLSVLSTFLAYGMDDPIGRLVHPVTERMTHPSAFRYRWKAGDKRLTKLRTRLDYILLSPSLMNRCIAGKVMPVEELSDHYPIYVILSGK